MQNNFEITNKILDYRKSIEKILTNSGNLSIKKNKQQILKAFDICTDILQLTRDEFGQIVIAKNIEIVTILIDELNLGTKSVIAAIFFSIKGLGSIDEIDIKSEFGSKVDDIVQTLFRMPLRLSENPKNKAEDLRNLLLTISYDLRVTFIVLARKLQEVRSLSFIDSNLRLKKFATEILDIFAPLAHRIGLYDIKTELEDLSFKLFQPDIYNYLTEKLEGTESQRMLAINKFSIPIIEELDNQHIKYDIDGRIKSIYSIWNKMQKKHVTFDEIYDIYAIRIIFDPISELSEITQCWNIFSIVTEIYSPKLDRIRNWISKPKENGYEALHVTVLGNDGKWVEIQIRSKRMDEFATMGMAAHWKYKGYSTQETPFDKLIKQLQNLKDFNSDNPYELLDNFKSNVLYPDIYVFTPKDEIVKLKNNSTVLDFAFHIHTDLGVHCIGAKVNYQTVAPDFQLKSGDKVYILTSQKQKPKREWLKIVQTEKAKENLRLCFKRERKNYVLKGYKIIEKLTKDLHIYFDYYIFRKLAKAFSVGTKEQLYYKIGIGEINQDNIISVLKERSKRKKINLWQLKCINEVCEKTENIERAKCCLPKPGDEIIGLKFSHEIIAHRRDCSVALSVLENHPLRKRNLKWKILKESAKLITLEFRGIDRLGVANELTSVVSNEMQINLRTINLETDQRNFHGKIELYYPDRYNINELIMRLMKVKGMKKVNRI